MIRMLVLNLNLLRKVQREKFRNQQERCSQILDTLGDLLVEKVECHDVVKIQECIVQKVKASDAILGEKDCSRIVSDKGNDQGLENQSNTSGDESSRSRNELEKVDSNVILDSPDMYDNEIQTDQNVVECDDERATLANLIANLKLDIDENKKIQKQLKKANASLTQELKECKSTLAETSRTLAESNSIRDSCLIALQNKQTEFERYKAFNDHTFDYDKLEHKLNETLGLLAQKEIDIKEGLKLKACEISVIKEKHDELVKQSLLAKSHYEGLVKEKTKIPHDQSDPANRLVPDREETLTLERESRSKLNKDLVRPYDYTKLNSLYEIFKPPTQEYHVQLAHANEVRKKMWRKSFVKTKPNIFKNIDFLPVSKSISKSRQAYNVMTNNINHFRELVDQAWVKHSKDHFRAPTAHDMEILIKTCLMPLALKTQNDSFAFVHELKQEMHDDLKYVESIEKEIDELESEKAEFSNMYDIPLQECVSNDVMCSYLHSLSDLDAHAKLQCFYVHKVRECECLAQKLSKQTETVSKEVYNDLLRNLKAQLQDKNIAISELKKLIEKNKGKGVDTNFEKQSSLGKPPLQPIKNQPVKDKDLNTKPSVQQSARLPNIANGNKPKPRNFNQQPRNWPSSISSRVSNRTVNTAEPPRNQKPFLKSKDLACSTCKKCIYSANHDECILKYLSKVNSRASAQKKDAQSHKITKRFIPIEKKSDSKNHGRQIPIGQRFSPNKSSNVYLKTTPPRSVLTWKPTGRIFTQAGLKWIPIRKSVETCYNTNDSASPFGKETHNPKTVIYANSSSLSVEHPSDTKVFILKMEILLEPTSSKLLVGGSSKLNLPVHRYKRRCCNLIPSESESLPHAQTTKTYYKNQDSSIKKAQVLKTKTSPNSDIKDNTSKTKLRGRLLESFQEDAKYEHVGEDTRLQDGRDNKTNKENI
ncbi:hypothetical protein Tco_0739392 [Tanacetum coccineum]